MAMAVISTPAYKAECRRSEQELRAKAAQFEVWAQQLKNTARLFGVPWTEVPDDLRREHADYKQHAECCRGLANYDRMVIIDREPW